MDRIKRVLWFTHNDCGYSKKFFSDTNISHTGTWTESIAKLMLASTSLELGIAFRSKWYGEKRKDRNITYFPIKSKVAKHRISRFFYKIQRRKIDFEEGVDDYLEIIKKFDPDIIHVFGTEENFAFISKYTKIPVVVSIQGNLTVYNWKYFSGLSKEQLFAGFDLKKAIRFSSPYHVYRLFKEKAQREQELFKHIKYVIGRTDWDRRISRILSPQSRYFVNDEVLRESFYEMEPQYSSLKGNLKIVTISGPAPYKGLETVCMAVSLLNDLDIEFSWSVIGVASGDGLITSVQKKLKDKFPISNIHFLGKMDEESISYYLNQSNLYVIPSHIENSPLTLSEAMISGIPVIASYSGGIPSRISDREGLLIQSGDPWSLAGAVLEVKKDYENTLAKAKLARERALLRHDRKKIIGDLINVYAEIISTND